MRERKIREGRKKEQKERREERRDGGEEDKVEKDKRMGSKGEWDIEK